MANQSINYTEDVGVQLEGLPPTAPDYTTIQRMLEYSSKVYPPLRRITQLYRGCWCTAPRVPPYYAGSHNYKEDVGVQLLGFTHAAPDYTTIQNSFFMKDSNLEPSLLSHKTLTKSEHVDCRCLHTLFWTTQLNQ